MAKAPLGGVPLSVARANAARKEAEIERLRDEERMLGNKGESDPSKRTALDPHTRLNVDKRAARKLNRRHFVAAIDEFRERMKAGETEKLFKKNGKRLGGGKGSGVYIFIRKRPLFQYERDRGEFDVVSAPDNAILVHNCQMHPDMKRMKLRHLRYPCDVAFGAQATNADVYDRAAKPFVSAAVEGSLATMFMYGQTGSGKTFTMGSIIETACAQLFALIGANTEVVLSFFELAGKKCVDLLSQSGYQEVILRENRSGGMEVVGGERPIATSAPMLMSLINIGYKRRATDSTDVNNTSSRSHAVCQLRLPSGGVLTLVDCAGSERKEDTMYHNKERRKEAAEINASLHALKECIRCIVLKRQSQRHVHVPFRNSNLTKVLQESFTRDDALVGVIATLSPTPTDTEHSMSTLKTACVLGGRESQITEFTEEVGRATKTEVLRVHPSKWSGGQLLLWLQTADKGRLVSFALDHSWITCMDGKQVFRLTEPKLITLCGDKQQGRRMYKALRAEAKVVELQKKQRVIDNKMEARNTAVDRW